MTAPRLKMNRILPKISLVRVPCTQVRKIYSNLIKGFFKRIYSARYTKLLIKPNPKLGNAAFGIWYADGYGTFSKPFIYRTGGILGANSNWIHSLEDQRCIIVLNNTDGTNLYGMSEQFYLVSKGEKPSMIKNK
jgi:hypothetical protein